MNNSRGQAMVETLLIIVFLTLISFATIQLCNMVINDMESNEAAFAINRVSIVSKRNHLKRNMGLAATFLFSRKISAITNLDYAPYKLSIYKKDLPSAHSPVEVYNASINYIQRTNFASLMHPSISISIGRFNRYFIKNTSRSRMIKSPDEEYYDKAYPNAETFSLF